jgi:hypothetical protein
MYRVAAVLVGAIEKSARSGSKWVRFMDRSSDEVDDDHKISS